MSGLLLIGKQEKLLAVLSEIGVVNPQKNYGKVCRQFIAVFRRVRTLNPLLNKGFNHFIVSHQRRHRYKIGAEWS